MNLNINDSTSRLKASDLLDVKLSSSNRHINPLKLNEQVTKYITSYRDNNEIYFFDYFHIGKTTNMDYYIMLDGQHRQQALKKIINDINNNINTELYENIDKNGLLTFINNFRFDVKKYDNIINVEHLAKLINIINDRQAYNLDVIVQKVRPFIDSKLLNFFNTLYNSADYTFKVNIEPSLREHLGSLYLYKISKIICENNILVNEFNNCIDVGNYDLMNKLFQNIIDYNNTIVNKLKEIINNDNLNLNQKLSRFYTILQNNKLEFHTSQITEVKKQFYKKILKQVSNNFVLNLVHDRDYELWLKPLISTFINENINENVNENINENINI